MNQKVVTNTTTLDEGLKKIPRTLFIPQHDVSITIIRPDSSRKGMKELCKTLIVHGQRVHKRIEIKVEHAKVINTFRSIIAKRLTKLRNLSISFIRSPEIGNKELEILCSEISRSLPLLQNLSLGLESTAITNPGLGILSREISRQLLNLKHLRISIETCMQITNAGLEAITSNVSRGLANLQQFTFIGPYTITNQGIRALIVKNSKFRTNLQQLTLSLRYSHGITHHGLKSLALNASKHFTNLQRLSINLESCEKLLSLGGNYLVAELSSRPTKLKHLYLSVKGSEMSRGLYDNLELLTEIKNQLNFIQDVSMAYS